MSLQTENSIRTLCKKNERKKIGVKAKETKFKFLASHQNSGQNISIANTFFENVTKFKYLGKIITNKN
jgi:hypothetical protein